MELSTFRRNRGRLERLVRAPWRPPRGPRQSCVRATLARELCDRHGPGRLYPGDGRRPPIGDSAGPGMPELDGGWRRRGRRVDVAKLGTPSSCLNQQHFFETAVPSQRAVLILRDIARSLARQYVEAWQAAISPN